MTASIIIGEESNGKAVPIDIEELLATRLLVQGNSGSGKSHLLRRLLEESAPLVQQVVVDPEGDFVTLAEPFGHIVVDGAAYNTNDLVRLANRVRQHRASVVLALDGLEIEAQMRCAATFLNALFDAPREIWYPALVVVDEAQMFAPAAAGEVTDEVRRLSLSAMTNLMCRGRKRGLAGIIATQRLAKLAKNVAAEASNFLMGRTFLDIDMQRAADLLGMERRQAETIRDLQRGQFLALGPAITRRPLSVRIGGVQTRSRAVSTGLLPPPSVTGDDLHALLHAAPTAEELAAEETPLLAGLPRPDASELMDQISTYVMAPAPGEEPLVDDSGPNLFSAASVPAPPSLPPEEVQSIMAAIMEDITAERDCTYQPISSLFQDFTTRCRMKKIGQHVGDVTQFRRRFALAVAGIYRPTDEEWAPLLQLSRSVPDDLLTPFLVIARAAMDEAPCPDDEALARAYGTSSPGRIRRLLEHLEKSNLIVVKTDYSGRRSIGIPDLGVSTAAV
ncbi:ATP-binding protein [Novosphingobium humi]|uniref:ATP-binding protein n=1 Tax=Novosphingobium humi TaxID=2282397 RepID=UPI0025B0B70A|nr:ATP-binding protein [Novosphingobium humi]WJS97420.1 ATP-binding protein [Novosphingobium humi]